MQDSCMQLPTTLSWTSKYSTMATSSNEISIEQIKQNADKLRNKLVNRKIETENPLRKLMEMNISYEHDQEYWLQCEIENQLLHICERETVVNLLDHCLSIEVDHEQEAMVFVSGREAMNLIGLARTTVECMKLTEWRKCGDEEVCCTICMEELALVRVTLCSHLVHSRRLFKWLTRLGSRSGHAPFRPTCRCLFRKIKN